jgi:TM2 domain-containing membrane protein YozV
MNTLGFLGVIIGFSGTILLIIFLLVPDDKGEHLFWGLVCLIIGAIMMAKAYGDEKYD